MDTHGTGWRHENMAANYRLKVGKQRCVQMTWNGGVKMVADEIWWRQENTDMSTGDTG